MKPEAHCSLLSSGLHIQALAEHCHEDWWENTQRGLAQVGRPRMELLVSVSVSPKCLPLGPSLLPTRLFLAPPPAPSGAGCLCPQRHLSFQGPFLIPVPLVAAVHSPLPPSTKDWIGENGFRNGTVNGGGET